MSRFVLTAQLQLQAPNNVQAVVRQIQQQLQGVTVNVNVQGTAQAQRQLQQVTQQTNAATSAADRMGRAFALSVRRFAAFSIATRAVSLFTSNISSAVDEAIKFERQLIKVSQVTGKTVSQLRFLTKEINSLATGFGVASSDLLSVSTVLAQAGLSANDTTVALRTLAKAALAPNFDSISETAEGAIAILAQFQQGVGALEAQLGSINAVAGAFAVEAGDLIDVIRRTGGVFKASGGSLNELLALFTSVRATTRESAESIGTGLRTIFTRIQRPKTIEYLKQFGIELVDLEGKFVGPFEAVRRLSDALSGLGEGDITFIRIAEELGGFRQIGKVLPLLQQFKTAQQALNVAQGAGNSLTDDAAKAQLALAIRITKVKEEFLALVRGITETTTFQVMANTALALASALIKIGDAIKPLLPLLATVAAIRFTQGIGTFIGGAMRGATSARQYSTGGKVHHFARGGSVPGTGNRDTVPAMLQPGEFVIRKNSVAKIGAGNLAAMNENRFALGGTVGAIALNPIGTSQQGGGTVTLKDIYNKLVTNNQLKGGISGNLKLFNKDGSLTNLVKNRQEAPDGKYFSERMDKIVSRIAFNGKKQQKFTTKGVSFPSTKNSETTIEQGIKNKIITSYESMIPQTAAMLASSIGLPTSVGKFNQNIIKSIGIEDATGKVFEGAISSLGAPFDAHIGKQDRDSFDFPFGLGSNLSQFQRFADLKDKPTDAKKTLDSRILNDIASRKTANTLSEQVNTSNAFQQLKQRILSQENSKEGKTEFPKPRGPRKKFFGGLIQKFAVGGMAKAPLIDDIVNASGTMMPRPSSAIAALIRAGGGAIDIDRTIKRTIGDKAYGSARTKGAQSSALEKYFRDPQARLNDVRSAPFTSFGQELQAAIKSGQINPSRLSIVSKSRRVPGVAEYLSQLFGIPLGNMIFTQGGSKQPAMDALRTKGPRASRVQRFAVGGEIKAREQKIQDKAKGRDYGRVSLREDGSSVTATYMKDGRVRDGFVTASKYIDNLYSIGLSRATKGYGPKLYDIVMEAVTSKGGMLTSDRSLVSGDARNVWDFYFKNRPDVRKTPLDPKYWTKNSSLIDPKLSGKKETWPPPTDPAWVLQSGYSKSPSIINSPAVVRAAGPSQNSRAMAAQFFSANRFATGGGVGTDTVPALLTPGEFVINRSSAQSIGYGSLNRMNKVGKYAKGGVVQNFASGSSGPVTAKTFKSNVAGLANNGGLQQAIVAASQEMKATSNYLKVLKGGIDKQTKITNILYTESASLDAKIKRYDAELVKMANQQGKAVATGTAANRILDMKMKAEAERVKVDAKAIKAEQTLTGLKDKEAKTLQDLIAAEQRRTNAINQAKSNKQAATQLVQQPLTGGTQTNFREAHREQSYTQARIKNRERQSQGPTFRGRQLYQSNASNRQQRGGSGGSLMPKDIGGAAIAISMVTSSLQAMLPPLDENASMLTKLSHSGLSLITTLSGVAFALQSFGIQLKASSMKQFFGGSLSFGARKGIMGAFSNPSTGRAVASFAQGLTKLGGPVLAVVGGLFALQSAINLVVESYKKQSEEAIKAGNVEEAGKNARNASTFSATGIGSVIGGTIGSVAGGIAGAVGGFGFGAVPGAVGGGVAGAGIGGTIGGVIDEFMGGASQAEKIARLRAGEVKVTLELEKASKAAARALKDLQSGSKTALEVLDTFKSVNIAEQAQRQEFDKSISAGAEGGGKAGKLSGFARGTLRVATLGIAGLAGLESGSQLNQRVSKENVGRVAERRKTESELFSQSSEARNASIRSLAGRGLDRSQIEQEFKSRGMDTVGDIKTRASRTREQEKKAFESGDLPLAQELGKFADDLENRAADLDQAFINIEKEVKRAKALFNAMNLGLRPAIATSTALSASLERLQSGFEVGGSTVLSDIKFLETALSSAAQAMDTQDLNKAMENVGNSLTEFGVSDAVVNKFKGNMDAFIQAQKNYNSAVGVIKADLEKTGQLTISPDKFQERLADELTKGMADGEAKDNLKAVIEGLKLDEGEVNDIIGGDLSVLGDKLSEVQKKQIEDITKIAEERQKAEQILIDFTKKRIDAERNYIAAQQQAIDLIMEGRDVQAKYGGKAVTEEEKRSAISSKSNVQSNRLGLTNLRTGSVAELRQRNAEIRQGVSSIEQQRQQRGGMQGRGGVEADERSKDLQQAQKEQVNTIRSLIKLEEEELKIIQEKNKLEKSSLEALMKGDVESFFKQQSAVGAQAAIATGNKDIQSLYGAEALGMAVEDLRRQQEAGVQSVYGQQLGGRGGLLERGASSALGAFGVTDDRSAQVLAGTTPEEEARKARLRDLGGELGAAGDLGAEIAQMQVATAVMQVELAEIDFAKVRDIGNKAAEQGNRDVDARRMYKGGPVYASRGIFVPRGTDTIPAMLTPGEFVVNRSAVQRGNNLQILQSMNRGSSNNNPNNSSGAITMSSGGQVRYRRFGSNGAEVASPEGGGGSDSMSKFTQALNDFNSRLENSIKSLSSVSISLKLDSTNVNVNLNNAEFLKTTVEGVKNAVLLEVEKEINNMRVGNDGGLKKNPGPINRSMGGN